MRDRERRQRDRKKQVEAGCLEAFCTVPDRHSDLDLDLDQYVANHPFTGIGATVGGEYLPALLARRL